MAAHEGLRVVITGAAGGIGRCAAERLQQSGARVVGIDIVASDLPFPLLRADVASEQDVIAAMAQAAELLGGLDAVVNAAGIGHPVRLQDMDLAIFDRLMGVNARGAVAVTREALRYFGGRGRVVNIASEMAYLSRAGSSIYCATKAALLSLTRSWARELAPNILVNAIAPGPIDTPLLGFASLSPEQQALETSNPLGRIGTVDEVAEAVLFLLNPRTGFITGQCISIDGGAAMH